MSTSQTILLRPRPLAKFSGAFLLLPLLPHPKPLRPLPAELWSKIFAYALACEEAKWSWSLLRVCKGFKEVALPLIYSSICLDQVSALQQFHDLLHNADQKWDSIRRIPYSTPGRWVQVLDLSGIAFAGQPQALLLDSVLARLFTVLPFLSTLYVNPSFVLSRRVLSSLADRKGAANLRILGGLSYVPPPSPTPDDDPFVQLLRCCPNLEELEIVGQGLDPAELEFNFHGLQLPPMDYFQPIRLPNLRILSLVSMHASPLMLALLHSPLPSLQKLTVTPYDDVPYPASLVTHLISTHGENLRSLILFAPKSWPARNHPSPHNVMDYTPNLRHLSLENPLPDISLQENHALQILSIPRPKADFWRVLERALRHLPNLAVLRARDVRWLRKGMGSMAQEAGVQGEMKEWRRRLRRWGIRLFDADWNESENE